MVHNYGDCKSPKGRVVGPFPKAKKTGKKIGVANHFPSKGLTYAHFPYMSRVSENTGLSKGLLNHQLVVRTY